MLLLRAHWPHPGLARTAGLGTRSARTRVSPCRRRSARPSTASSAAPSRTTSARRSTRIREAVRVGLIISVDHRHSRRAGLKLLFSIVMLGTDLPDRIWLFSGPFLYLICFPTLTNSLQCETEYAQECRTEVRNDKYFQSTINISPAV